MLVGTVLMVGSLVGLARHCQGFLSFGLAYQAEYKQRTQALPQPDTDPTEQSEDEDPADFSSGAV